MLTAEKCRDTQGLRECHDAKQKGGIRQGEKYKTDGYWGSVFQGESGAGRAGSSGLYISCAVAFGNVLKNNLERSWVMMVYREGRKWRRVDWWQNDGKTLRGWGKATYSHTLKLGLRSQRPSITRCEERNTNNHKKESMEKRGFHTKKGNPRFYYKNSDAGSPKDDHKGGEKAGTIRRDISDRPP